MAATMKLLKCEVMVRLKGETAQCLSHSSDPSRIRCGFCRRGRIKTYLGFFCKICGAEVIVVRKMSR